MRMRGGGILDQVSQNIYDDPNFHDAYRRLPRSEHGLEGAPEWPTVVRLLPELNGRDVADLGCGFGAFARWAAERGARVDAFDVSQRMLARAGELTSEGAAINYQRADLDQLELHADAYDVGYSALTAVELYGRLGSYGRFAPATQLVVVGAGAAVPARHRGDVAGDRAPSASLRLPVVPCQRRQGSGTHGVAVPPSPLAEGADVGL